MHSDGGGQEIPPVITTPWAWCNWTAVRGVHGCGREPAVIKVLPVEPSQFVLFEGQLRYPAVPMPYHEETTVWSRSVPG